MLFRSPVVGAVAAITAVIVGLVAAGIYLYTHWEEVKAKAIEIWDAIKEGVSNAVSALGDFISATWDGIKAFLSTCWELIKSAANTVWNGIKTVISTAINIIKTIITTVFNAIKLYITTVFNTIKSLTTSVWNGIKTVINSACNTVKSTVSNVFNGLKNTVKNALDSVYNTAKGIWNKVTGIFTKPISAVVNFVKGGKAGKAAKASYSMLNPKSIPQAQSYAAVSKNYSASEKMASYSRSNSAGINNSSSSPISLSANLNSFVQLDGKTLAKATAPYMSNELDKLTKRKNRLGGAFA